MNCHSKIITLALLTSASACIADATTAVSPFLNFRSQGQDRARKMVGTTEQVYKADMDKHYGVFTVLPEYTRSFHNGDITHSLFGCYILQDCNSLAIVGSEAPSFIANGTDLAAEWFYLAPNYEGSVSFKPVIQNFNTDLGFYWGMDEWVQGLFLRLNSTLTWTKWNLGAKFTTTNKGTLIDDTITYLDDAEKFFCESKTDSDTNTDADAPIGLNCARFCGCSCDDNKTKTRLADVQMDVGWNFLLDENYHLGLFARVVAPTGNKIKGEWLFEPVVGNGHHWELGGGLTGSAILWRNAEEDKHLGFYVDADITHLFKTNQNRVFDLKNKPLSRYIQAWSDVSEQVSPLANLTSCKMDVSVAVQADVAALFNYTCKNWSYDLGYNFWVRSCEKFDCDCDCDCDSCDDCTSCCGQCVIKNGNTESWTIFENDAINTFNDSGTETTLTDDMINYDGARTKGISHKIFANINYAWMDREIVPFIGLGGFAEFGHHDSCCDDCDDCNSSCSRSCNDCNDCDDCSCCKNVAFSQWGLWLKGGVTF